MASWEFWFCQFEWEEHNKDNRRWNIKASQKPPGMLASYDKSQNSLDTQDVVSSRRTRTRSFKPLYLSLVFKCCSRLVLEGCSQDMPVFLFYFTVCVSFSHLSDFIFETKLCLNLCNLTIWFSLLGDGMNAYMAYKVSTRVCNLCSSKIRTF
jgi:hypothetical protein